MSIVVEESEDLHEWESIIYRVIKDTDDTRGRENDNAIKANLRERRPLRYVAQRKPLRHWLSSGHMPN